MQHQPSIISVDLGMYSRNRREDTSHPTCRSTRFCIDCRPRKPSEWILTALSGHVVRVLSLNLVHAQDRFQHAKFFSCQESASAFVLYIAPTIRVHNCKLLLGLSHMKVWIAQCALIPPARFLRASESVIGQINPVGRARKVQKGPGSYFGIAQISRVLSRAKNIALLGKLSVAMNSHDMQFHTSANI